MASQLNFKLALACGVPVGRRSGGRLATTLVATKNDIIFFSCEATLDNIQKCNY